MIAAAAPHIEANRELPADLVDALHEARLYRMLVPRSLWRGRNLAGRLRPGHRRDRQGRRLHGVVHRADFGVLDHLQGMKPEVAEEIFKKNPRGVLAWGPTGSGKAVVEKGGFRVSGTWPFASGSRQATWLAAHCIVYEPNGEPRRDAEGKPIQKTIVLPREKAKIDDVWHVIGLKGTGSDTYTFTDVFVPEQYAIGFHALNPAEWRERGPLYQFTIYQLFGASFPAVALGIARATLDAFCALAQKKTPTGQSVMLRDNPVVQSQVGVAQSSLAAARCFLLDALEEIWRAAQSGSFTMDQRVRLRMACINASQQARQVVENAYLAAGATAVFQSNPFERRFRDMHAVSQQAQSQFAIYEAVGRHFLGLPPNSRLI